jgi:hypothetical protein
LEVLTIVLEIKKRRVIEAKIFPKMSPVLAVVGNITTGVDVEEIPSMSGFMQGLRVLVALIENLSEFCKALASLTAESDE